MKYTSPRLIRQILLVLLASITYGFAQRGTMTIPIASSLTIPLNAQVCADTIYANGTGHGTLTIANSNCLCAGTVVVPVELLIFSGSYRGASVELEWTTASETNCIGFEVQRSNDESDWKKIGFVNGSGTSLKQNNYRFADQMQDAAISGALFYRLKILDTDGSYEYSPVVEVTLENLPIAPTLFTPYPNPASDCVTLRFSLPKEMNVSVTIFTINGEMVQAIKQSELTTNGSHVLQASLTNVSSGTYMIVLEANDFRSVQQFVMRR